MTLQQEIQQWQKNGCIYIQGVAIYKKIGGTYPNKYFEAYLAAPFIPKEVSNNLKFFLTNYTGSEPAPIEPISSSAKPISDHRKQAEPAAIIALREEAKRFHKQHDYLKAKLIEAESDEARYELAYEIMEVVIPKIDRIYGKIKAYHETGELPEVLQPDIVRETVKKMQRVNSLKSRISRLNGLIKKSTDLEQRKYEKERLDKRLELQKLELELGLNE